MLRVWWESFLKEALQEKGCESICDCFSEGADRKVFGQVLLNTTVAKMEIKSQPVPAYE